MPAKKRRLATSGVFPSHAEHEKTSATTSQFSILILSVLSLFDWRRVKDAFLDWYFAYYQEEQVDLRRHPELRGLVTDWLSAEELVKIVKLGDLVEFKGTSSGMSLFHVRICMLPVQRRRFSIGQSLAASTAKWSRRVGRLKMCVFCIWVV